AVELGLGQRVGALLLDRVLRGEDGEDARQRVAGAVHGHLPLLHRLEQRGLRLGGARLISSPSRNWANTGPGRKWKPCRSGSKMLVPTMSAGIRSGVNWMRLKSQVKMRARTRTSRVLAVPGMPSMSRWPPANSVTSSDSMTSPWPTITLAISRRADSYRLP